MPLQMVDWRERQLPGSGERLGRGEPDQQRPHQAGTLGRRDHAYVVQRHARLAQRLLDDQVHQLQMVPGGDLRDDPAEPAVDLLR